MSLSESSIGTSLSLLELARRHDPGAWRRLCQIYAPLVYGWARKAGLHENDAPDIVQEVFRIVASHIDRFQHDRPEDTFRGWLLTITRTEVRGFFRRQGRQAVAAEGGSTALQRIQQIPDGQELALDSSSWADDRSARRDLVRRAAETVRQDFEPQTWQAFWRCVVEEQAAVDVAAELGMTANSVRQAKFRVLARLRETLQDL